MNLSKKQLMDIGKILGLALVLSIGIGYISAAGNWTRPAGPPPGNNTDAPVNVGITTQNKNGTLGVNALGVFGQIQILGAPDKAAAPGYVLTADDVNGFASWQPIGGGGSGGSYVAMPAAAAPQVVESWKDSNNSFNNTDSPPINSYQTIDLTSLTGGVAKAAVLKVACGQTQDFIKTITATGDVRNLTVDDVNNVCGAGNNDRDSQVVTVNLTNGSFQWMVRPTQSTWQTAIYLIGYYK